MAQEITDGFEHLMDIGGSGGVPVDDGRCLQYAKDKFVALKDYFCLFCNPRQIKYLGCCNDGFKNGGDCKPTAGNTATDKELMKRYGEEGCTDKAADTIRICKRFADELWGKENGKKYDSCGMMHWVTGEDVSDDNAWADKDGTDKQQGNINGVLPWGDVDGRSGKYFAQTALSHASLFYMPFSTPQNMKLTAIGYPILMHPNKRSTGDDPITPSQQYDSVDAFFHDVRPPLFDQFRVTVVADEDGDCFDGYLKRGIGFVQQPSVLLFLASLLASLLWA